MRVDLSSKRLNCRGASLSEERIEDQVKIPARAPLMQVAIVPETIDRVARITISCLRSGIIALIPPTIIPTLPKLANPHMA